jgi:hypothetical protein
MIVTFLKLHVNVMNKNIKIQNIFELVKISKSMQQNHLLKYFFYVFPIFFQSLISSEKMKM